MEINLEVRAAKSGDSWNWLVHIIGPAQPGFSWLRNNRSIYVSGSTETKVEAKAITNNLLQDLEKAAADARRKNQVAG